MNRLKLWTYKIARMKAVYLWQFEEGETTREGEGLGHSIGHLLPRGTSAVPHLLLLLLPDPGAGWLRCPGGVV